MCALLMVLVFNLAWFRIGSAPWPVAVRRMWGIEAATKTQQDLQNWCDRTDGVFVLAAFVTPAGFLVPCVVRGKAHPNDAKFFEPCRISKDATFFEPRRLPGRVLPYMGTF